MILHALPKHSQTLDGPATHRRVARQDACTSGLSWLCLRTSSAATTIEEAQRGFSHKVRHQSRPASRHLRRPCRKLSSTEAYQLPSRSALPSTRTESLRLRRRSRKLTGRISTICSSPDILHAPGTSVQTWPSQRTSHPRSRTRVRQALRSTRRPASTLTTRGPLRSPTCRARRDRQPPSPLPPSPLAPGPLSHQRGKLGLPAGRQPSGTGSARVLAGITTTVRSARQKSSAKSGVQKALSAQTFPLQGLKSAGNRCSGILAYGAMTSMSLGRVVTILHFFLT